MNNSPLSEKWEETEILKEIRNYIKLKEYKNTTYLCWLALGELEGTSTDTMPRQHPR